MKAPGFNLTLRQLSITAIERDLYMTKQKGQPSKSDADRSTKIRNNPKINGSDKSDNRPAPNNAPDKNQQQLLQQQKKK